VYTQVSIPSRRVGDERELLAHSSCEVVSIPSRRVGDKTLTGNWELVSGVSIPSRRVGDRLLVCPACLIIPRFHPLKAGRRPFVAGVQRAGTQKVSIPSRRVGDPIERGQALLYFVSIPSRRVGDVSNVGHFCPPPYVSIPSRRVGDTP